MTPWYWRWKKWQLDKTRFKDHELIDQPVAFIYFVMANDPDPLRTIEKFKKDLPQQYKLQVYNDNRNCVQEFVFVLNLKPGVSPAFQDACQTIGQKFHQNLIFEVPMSSKNVENGPVLQDIWHEKYIDMDTRNLIDI